MHSTDLQQDKDDQIYTQLSFEQRKTHLNKPIHGGICRTVSDKKSHVLKLNLRRFWLPHFSSHRDEIYKLRRPWQVLFKRELLISRNLTSKES